jgi:beta propeller repeat protein
MSACSISAKFVLLVSILLIFSGECLSSNQEQEKYKLDFQNNQLTLEAKNVSFKKILSDLEEKTGIKVVIVGEVQDRKVTLDIKSLPLYSVGSLFQQMKLINYSVVYDTSLSSLAVYVLSDGMNIADVVKGKPVILQADFAGNADSAKQVKGSFLASEEFGKNKVPVRYIADEVFIQFNLGVTDSEIEEILKKHNLIKITANNSLEKLGYIKAKVPDGRDVIAVIKEVRKEYLVKVPEPNYVADVLAAAPLDPFYTDQWYIPETKFDLAWEKLKSNQNIKVAVIDSGVDKTHPDLQGKILAGYDFVNLDDDPLDDNGHGTFVSGIIAANTNDIGIKGLYDFARIIPVKVIDQNGIGSYEDAAAGIVYAADQGAQVINLSIGGYGFSFLLQDAVDYALDKGCILVAAGGNDGIEQPIYPAAYPDVMGVAATTQDSHIWLGSNSGKHIDVSAPGVNIVSLGKDGNYIVASGTSASAAMVSAQAAMLVNDRTTLSSSFVQKLIGQSSLNLEGESWNPIYGEGIIDVDRSLTQDLKPFLDVGVSKIGIDTNRVKRDKKLYVMVLLKNLGILVPQNFSVEISVNQQKYTEKIDSLQRKKKISIIYPLNSQTESVQISARIIYPYDIYKENNFKSSRYFVKYDEDQLLWILYHQNAHTWIAGEAFGEWPNNSDHEIYNYIGSPLNQEYQQSFAIIAGSFNEDCGDGNIHCWSQNNPFDHDMPFLRHFWDRGHQDNATPIQGALSGSDDTAVNRAYKYWTGGYGWDGVYDADWDDGEGVRGKGVIQLYLDGDQQSKNRAFRYLGHIAHLLTDMALPAHVLGDIHGGAVGGDDQYEEWISENDSQGAPHYRRFGDVAGIIPVDSSGVNFPSVTDLRDLFQQLAEIGDEFESDSYDGGDDDNNNDYGDHRKNHADNLFGDVSDAECAIHQETLQPAAIRYVAALYKLFWNTTHPSSIDNFYAVPSTVVQGSSYVLIVEANDSNGQPTRAEFYLDTNGNGQLDVSVDQLVGVDTNYNLGFSYMGYANLSPGSHSYFARIQDDSGQWSEPGSTELFVSPVSATQGTVLSISASDWNADEAGDDDGVIETSEAVRLRLKLASSENIGSFFATLSSSLGNLNISDSTEQYPAISAGGYAWPYGSGFDMYLDLASTTSVPFNLHVEYSRNGLDYYQNFTFNKTFYENGSRDAAFEIVSMTIDDSTAQASYNNGDGIIQSGEHVEVRPMLKNNGQAGATDIEAWLTYSGTAFSVDGPSDTENYPDLDPSQEAYPLYGASYDIRDIRSDYTGIQNVDFHLAYYQSATELLLPSAIELYIQPAAWLSMPEDYWDFGVAPPGTPVVHTTAVHNVGSSNLTISGINTSHADTTWSGVTLPLVLAPGASSNLEITIDTTGLQGTISREVTIISDGRVRHPGEDDKLIISGLVSNTIPVSIVPDVTGTNHPDISGEKIVWSENRNGNTDIFAFDTAAGVEYQITTDTNSQYRPFISGNLIVWKDYRNNPGTDDSDIYAYDLSKPELGVFPVSIVSPWAEDVIGVDGNLVAVTRVYESLLDDSSGDEAHNVHVYEYDGNGGFSEIWSTGYAPGSGDNPRQNAYGEGDFSEGFLVFEQSEIFMFIQSDGDRTWQWRNQATYAIDFGQGDTSTTKVFDGSRILSAASHRLVSAKESAGGDNEIWLWRTGVAPEKLVSEVGEDAANDVLAIGGPDGQDIVAYDWRGIFRPGLMYIDRGNGGQESAITTSGDPSDLRADRYGLVWVDVSDASKLYYTYLKQADIAVTASDISFSSETPVEGDSIDVSVLVHNLLDYNLTDDITVRLDIGDPDTGGVQIGSDQDINGGLAGKDSQSVDFLGIVIPAGAGGSDEERPRIYARIISVPGYDNPANNKAYKYLTVYDDDIEGPSISNVLVEEYNGDGDSVIGADEQIKISWDLNDLSGIGPISLLVDGVPLSLDGNYYALLGPLSSGEHNFSITATDTDASPEASQHNSSFNVVINEEITVLYNSISINNASVINVVDVPVGTSNANILFVVRNDGDQMLTLGDLTINVTQGDITTSGLITANLPGGSLTYFTIAPDTSSIGLFSCMISITSSDSNENPFNFTISGEIVPLPPDDADGDGIDDDWEMFYFGSLDVVTISTDYDNDGYSDLQEYLNWSNGIVDPDGNEFSPKYVNAPGGEGYENSDSHFWLLILPAILATP